MQEQNKSQGISVKGIEELILSEGFKECPYLDSVNIPTIGIGSTFYEDGTKVSLSDDCITRDRAIKLAMFTINKIFVPGILKVLTVSQNQNQIDALTNLVYNIGVHAFSSS